MKRLSILFLKIVILLIAIVTLVGMIRFPQTEGRAVNLDIVSIYADPFIIYIYIASIPFFAVLYQAFKLLGYVDENKIFSLAAIKAVRYIKYCAAAIIGFLVVAIFYIRVMAQGDDPAGPTMIGLLAIIASVVIVTASAIFQKLLQHAYHITSKV